MARTPSTTVDKARALRREPTDAERRLWSLLRGHRLGWRFRRQHPVAPYILDFACVEAKVAVEADGGQHNGSPSDALRAEFLAANGWRVLRFWNTDILSNSEGVAETIRAALAAVRTTSPHPPTSWAPPSPSGAGGGAVKEEAAS